MNIWSCCNSKLQHFRRYHHGINLSHTHSPNLITNHLESFKMLVIIDVCLPDCNQVSGYSLQDRGHYVIMSRQRMGDVTFCHVFMDPGQNVTKRGGKVTSLL